MVVRLLLTGLFTLWTAGARGEDWRPLFNGKDLAGWRANNKSPLDETNWFRVNDVETVDCTEPENVIRPPERRGRFFAADGGAIALQAHDADGVWYFRQVRVRALP